MQPSDSPDALLAKIRELEATVKLRTDQLIASTSRSFSFFDSLSMGFIMCDVNPEIVLTNQTVRRLLNATAELNIAVVDNLFQPSLQLKQSVSDSLATGKPHEFEAVNVGKNVLRVYIAPMVSDSDGQKLGVIILVEDVTEQKNLERSKEEFLSIASHELRTPLTAIRGNSALIQKYYAEKLPDKDVSEMIDDIHESAIRLIGIVNDFLDVSSLEQGKMSIKPAPLVVQEAVDEVFRDLQTLSDAKSIKLIAVASLASLPQAMADKQRIKQVVYNLVGNAIKFTEAGSITISGKADDNYVYVTVADTGLGMSVENQHLLFRKFQQAGSSLLTRDTTKSTGLGLYISKLIIEQSGGRIGLHSSEPGKGSAFSFSLPRAK